MISSLPLHQAHSVAPPRFGRLMDSTRKPKSLQKYVQFNVELMDSIQNPESFYRGVANLSWKIQAI